MVKKEFTNPINNETVELDECKLSKSIEDYEGRAERIPNVDKNYVDLGIQFKLAQLINSKNVSFKNEIPIHVALKGHMGTGKDHDIEQFAAKLNIKKHESTTAVPNTACSAADVQPVEPNFEWARYFSTETRKTAKEGQMTSLLPLALTLQGFTSRIL